MGNMLAAFGEVLCAQCAEQEIKEREGKENIEGAIGPILDPTVCAKCSKDFGERILETVAGVPFCPDCSDELRHYHFPAWVKAASALVIFLVIVSFVSNWRFFKGYLEMRSALRAHDAGNIDEAGLLMESASQRVPESRELAAAASFYRGLRLMREDKPEEAAPVFREVLRTMPPNQNEGTKMLLAYAEAGIAFNKKDYDGFLAKAQEILRMKPGDPNSLGQVASAHACKYAVTGDEKHKQEAIRYLEEAKKIASSAGDPDFKEYEERIRHRIETREIISKEEYDRKFRKAERGE